MRRRLLPAVAVALVAQAAGADGLADLRACVARLAAHDPVHATVTIEVRSTSKEKDAKGVPKTETGTVTVEAGAGPEGLSLAASPELLAAIREDVHPQGNGK